MVLVTLPLAMEPSLAIGNYAPARNPRWHPQAVSERYIEIFAASGDGGGAAACLALAREALRQDRRQDERAVLWVQEERAIKLAGRPFRPGLPEHLRHRLIHVSAASARDALFALEEGLRCRDLACVIGEFAGNPRALDFTASRRLALKAEKHGSRLFLLRHDARADLSAARMRWQVRSAPSAVSPWDKAAPGRAQWHAELFRARAHPPGEWTLRDDGDGLVAEVGARASAGSARTGFAPITESVRPELVEGYAHG